MEITKATKQMLLQIEEVYARAREFMAQTGNPNQWGQSYPSEDVILEDIASGQLYVVMEDGKVVGVFFFTMEPDPDYERIEDGAWKNDLPHGVIHRIASTSESHGILDVVLKKRFRCRCRHQSDSPLDLYVAAIGYDLRAVRIKISPSFRVEKESDAVDIKTQG